MFHAPLSRAPRLTLSAVVVATTFALGACGASQAESGPGEGQVDQAARAQAGAVSVEDPWVRATTGTEEPGMTAAFMAIDNDGDHEVTVVAASSPATEVVELHEMAMVDGASVMQEVEGGIVLPPGRGQLLQPGGMHVMLMGLTEELAPGDEVELVLELGDGSTVEVAAPVKEFTEETEHYHAPGTDKDHSHP